MSPLGNTILYTTLVDVLAQKACVCPCFEMLVLCTCNIRECAQCTLQGRQTISTVENTNFFFDMIRMPVQKTEQIMSMVVCAQPRAVHMCRGHVCAHQETLFCGPLKSKCLRRRLVFLHQKTPVYSFAGSRHLCRKLNSVCPSQETSSLLRILLKTVQDHDTHF